MYSLYNVFIKYLSQYIIINKNEICIYITFFLKCNAVYIYYILLIILYYINWFCRFNLFIIGCLNQFSTKNSFHPCDLGKVSLEKDINHTDAKMSCMCSTMTNIIFNFESHELQFCEWHTHKITLFPLIKDLKKTY